MGLYKFLPVETVMVNNFITISKMNKMNNYLSSEFTEHKKRTTTNDIRIPGPNLGTDT